MTPRVIGTRADVAGFALAGVDGTICTTAEDVTRAFAGLTADHMVILSASAAVLAREHITAAEKDPAGALFVVLPSG